MLWCARQGMGVIMDIQTFGNGCFHLSLKAKGIQGDEQYAGKMV